jgi:hypothetical protein
VENGSFTGTGSDDSNVTAVVVAMSLSTSSSDTIAVLDSGSAPTSIGPTDIPAAQRLEDVPDPQPERSDSGRVDCTAPGEATPAPDGAGACGGATAEAPPSELPATTVTIRLLEKVRGKILADIAELNELDVEADLTESSDGETEEGEATKKAAGSKRPLVPSPSSNPSPPHSADEGESTKRSRRRFDVEPAAEEKRRRSVGDVPATSPDRLISVAMKAPADENAPPLAVE